MAHHMDKFSTISLTLMFISIPPYTTTTLSSNNLRICYADSYVEPQVRIFVIFHTPPCWWGVENYETFQKVTQLAMITGQSYLYFLQNFGLKFLKPSQTYKNHSDGPKTLKSSNNYPYLISPFGETTEKHVFLPQKGPYLPNGPNRKRA